MRCRTPELARAMGSSINQFKKGLRDEEQGPDLLEGRTRETEDRA
jgi:Sec-independent protein translocase protein TatA